MATNPNAYAHAQNSPSQAAPKANAIYSINVNDPGLITLVNKLQDVFTTVGVRCSLPNLETTSTSPPFLESIN
jgi:hypothetical protein